MKASDYIVEFFIQHNITDVFGYPGGMVTHLMDSLDKYKDRITAHVNYHEQACAMAACGWAEITGLPGVAYATSGPGATNLLTGIACAYFESLPCLFVTGQVNTYEQRGNLGVRQKGFQETDIVSIARPVTKMAVMVESAEKLPGILEAAYRTAMEGRRGPVLVDIPMDVFRGEVLGKPGAPELPRADRARAGKAAGEILRQLQSAKRPVILAGHGISLAKGKEQFLDFVNQTGMPVVTSMIAVDVIPSSSAHCFGMIGAYGTRWANYMISHSDYILSLGSRLDCRQTGTKTSLFAPKSKILRVDIDPREMENRINQSEKQYCVSLEALLPELVRASRGMRWGFRDWEAACAEIRAAVKRTEAGEPGNLAAEMIGRILPDGVTVTTDVGQNQVWIAQSMPIKRNQRVLFSGGHGAMGYSLPAGIGAAIATKKPVICITGDGGLQMNLQEFQFIIREKLPIKIIVMNNRSLGMIHHFQEMYFDSSFAQTDENNGFSVPDFQKIAAAYGIRAMRFAESERMAEILADGEPALIEVSLPQSTHVFPKLGVNKPIYEQEPPLPEETMREIQKIYRGFCRRNTFA